MTMQDLVRNFAIMTIDSSREHVKAEIRRTLYGEWIEHPLAGVDGRDKRVLARYFAENPFVTFDGWHPRYGEAGFWGTLLNACQLVIDLDVPVAVIEDDAVLEDAFTELVDTYLAACPDDVDVFHLLTWFDRANLRSPALDPEPYRDLLVVENWHDWPFGGVVMFPSGAQKIVDHLHSNPITTVGDVWMFQAEQRGVFKAMAPAPYRTSPVAPRYTNTRSLIDRTQPVHPRILPRWKP